MESSGYAVYTARSADRGLDRMPARERERMLEAILALGDDPYPPGARSLRNSPACRIRVGDYRAIYEVDEQAKEVTVTKVAHRREVYRGRG